LKISSQYKGIASLNFVDPSRRTKNCQTVFNVNVNKFKVGVQEVKLMGQIQKRGKLYLFIVKIRLLKPVGSTPLRFYFVAIASGLYILFIKEIITKSIDVEL